MVRSALPLAAGLSLLTVVLLAMPNPPAGYSIRGAAFNTAKLFAEPLANVTFEIRALGGAEAADAWGEYHVPVARAASNTDGEFSFEGLSLQHSYRIRPIAPGVSFTPEAITLTAEEVGRLRFSRGVIEGFVFEKQ